MDGERGEEAFCDAYSQYLRFRYGDFMKPTEHLMPFYGESR